MAFMRSPVRSRSGPPFLIWGLCPQTPDSLSRSTRLLEKRPAKSHSGREAHFAPLVRCVHGLCPRDPRLALSFAAPPLTALRRGSLHSRGSLGNALLAPGSACFGPYPSAGLGLR